jgi:hypothetical protein
MDKGYPNVLDLEDYAEPLIIIGSSVIWAKAKHDELVQLTICYTIKQVTAAAAARQSDHPYNFHELLHEVVAALYKLRRRSLEAHAGS